MVVRLVEIASGDNVDLHRFVCVLRVSYRQPRSVAVADVPVAGLDLRGREGEGTTLGKRLTVGSGSCHHGVVLLSVGCHDGGEVRCFVHALSIGSQGVLWGFGGHSANWSGSCGVSVN